MDVVKENIKRLVRDSGLKQSAIAQKSKIPEKQFSALICGRKIIRPEHIANISIALGVTPNDLYGFPPSPNNKTA